MARIFDRVVLQTNLNKTKAVICTSGFIWGEQVSKAYKQQATGEGPTLQERKKTRVICKECGETMADSSLQNHTKRAHGRVLLQVKGVDDGGGGLEVYKLSFTWILESMD